MASFLTAPFRRRILQSHSPLNIILIIIYADIKIKWCGRRGQLSSGHGRSHVVSKTISIRRILYDMFNYETISNSTERHQTSVA